MTVHVAVCPLPTLSHGHCQLIAVHGIHAAMIGSVGSVQRQCTADYAAVADMLQAIKGFQKILEARPYETETAKTLARLHFRIKVPLLLHQGALCLDQSCADGSKNACAVGDTVL
jgi:hypothetical protein